jgi:3-hydroxyisobutyrate dehydrogenase-like beta-hydroxyacid dehydrogenase
MVNQILISTMMVGLVEGLIYGYKAGLDLNQVLAAVSAGAAGSWSLNNYTPRIFKRNFVSEKIRSRSIDPITNELTIGPWFLRGTFH